MRGAWINPGQGLLFVDNSCGVQAAAAQKDGWLEKQSARTLPHPVEPRHGQYAGIGGRGFEVEGGKNRAGPQIPDGMEPYTHPPRFGLSEVLKSPEPGPGFSRLTTKRINTSVAITL